MPADSLIPQLHPSPPSRRPHLRKQFKVIEEEFEEKVYRVGTREALQKRIERKQNEDDVIRNALGQLQRDGEVSMGQLKRSQNKMKVANGIRPSQDLVVPLNN